jgi:hypothetical protein
MLRIRVPPLVVDDSAPVVPVMHENLRSFSQEQQPTRVSSPAMISVGRDSLQALLQSLDPARAPGRSGSNPDQSDGPRLSASVSLVPAAYSDLSSHQDMGPSSWLTGDEAAGRTE